MDSGLINAARLNLATRTRPRMADRSSNERTRPERDWSTT